MIRRFYFAAMLIGLLSVNCLAPIRAQRVMSPTQTVEVAQVAINATIRDGVAETEMSQTFANHTDRVQEGDFLFPIPDGASVSSFAMYDGEKRMEAKLLEKDDATKTYEEIVSSPPRSGSPHLSRPTAIASTCLPYQSAQRATSHFETRHRAASRRRCQTVCVDSFGAASRCQSDAPACLRPRRH